MQPTIYQKLIMNLNKFALGQIMAERYDVFIKWVQTASEADHELDLDPYRNVLIQHAFRIDHKHELGKKARLLILEHPEYNGSRKLIMLRNLARIVEPN